MDNFQEILFTINKNRLRTALTAFGVFWGIFMLVMLLGVGKGLKNGISQGFASDDLTSMWITSLTTALPYKGLPVNRAIALTEDDINAIKKNIPGIQYISAENRAGTRWQGTINVSYKNKSGSFGVYGVADDFFHIKKYQEQRAGRKLNSLDDWEERKVAVIGTKVRDGLFLAHQDPIGQYIQFNGIMLKVVGVFYDKGAQERHSERVYIPLSTFQKSFGVSNKVGLITLTPKEGVDPFKLEEDVLSLLKERHIVSPEDTRAIRINNLSRHTQKLGNLFGAINSFIWFVGIGTLAAGVVGVSNIMIITVKDRSKEIGIRKALGATPLSIVVMILSESILVTSVAGYFGLVFGVGTLELTSSFLSGAGSEVARFFKDPEIDIYAALQALLILVFSGALAGLAPAARAAKISPTEAMREG